MLAVFQDIDAQVRRTVHKLPPTAHYSPPTTHTTASVSTSPQPQVRVIHSVVDNRLIRMLDANNTGLVEHGCCCCLDVLSSMLSLIVVGTAVTDLRHCAPFPEHALCEYRYCHSCEKVRNTNNGGV